MHLVNTTFLTSATHGLAAAIDDGSSTVIYGNLSRLLLTDLQAAVVNLGGGAVALANLTTLEQTMADQPHGEQHQGEQPVAGARILSRAGSLAGRCLIEVIGSQFHDVVQARCRVAAP